MRAILTSVLLLSAWLLPAQTAAVDSQLVDVNFRFTDGLYADAETLRTNRPGVSFKYLTGNLVIQEEEYLLKVESLHPQGRPDLPIDLQRIDFISIDGMPYIRAYTDEQRDFTVYAGLRVRGRLCYFAYERLLPDTVLIKAYNPLTGQAFRQQNVVREKVQLTENILELANGNISPFTRDHFLKLIQNDPALVKTVKNMTEEKAEERLQKTLLIYDDRHPIRLPSREEEKQ
jgi:hypothetical protein